MKNTIAGLFCLMVVPVSAMAEVVEQTVPLQDLVPRVQADLTMERMSPNPGRYYQYNVTVNKDENIVDVDGECPDTGYYLSADLSAGISLGFKFNYNNYQPAADEEKATLRGTGNCGFLHIAGDTAVNVDGGAGGLFIQAFAEAFGGGLNATQEGKFYGDRVFFRGNSGASGGGNVNAGDKATIILKNGILDLGTTQGHGGGLRAVDDSKVTLKNTRVTNNSALGSGSGGGAFIGGDAWVLAVNVDFDGNTAAGHGAGLAFYAGSWGTLNNVNLLNGIADGSGGGGYQQDTSYVEYNGGKVGFNLGKSGGGGYYWTDQASGDIQNVWYDDNLSGTGFGNQKVVATTPNPADMGVLWPSEYPGYVMFSGVLFSGAGNHNENPSGPETSMSSTYLFTANTVDGITTTGDLGLYNSLIVRPQLNFNLAASGSGKSTTEANCNDFGTGAITSLGYNISDDNSCALTRPTDLPGTDPMVVKRDDGFPAPDTGSPAIDSGLSDVMTLNNDELARLPCGYRDVSGTARPQDANGDGVFECDRGAIEVPGTGAIEPGHSAAYFNLQRVGEGSFVEIIDENTAVVWTFSYEPEGVGAAWFVAVCAIKGNGLVCDNVLRPVGASFGDAFDPNDVQLTPAGGMSVVLPDCDALPSAPGNVAFSGNNIIGFEGLITRAMRLTKITGCATDSPSEKAGLSGAYFAMDRSGEGIVVQWLDNDTVLVVFWTYTPDGKQIWMIGVGNNPQDNSVTLEVEYPTGFTSWGRGFDASEVVLEKWGTLTLSWTKCETDTRNAELTFTTNPTAAGYTGATYTYGRLTALAGTTCPTF